jgi:L-ascorbate metabolism protein UlaG (beta-lactamase superfamily)
MKEGKASTSQVSAPASKPMSADVFAKSEDTSIWWLSGSGFLINSRGTLIMIDPVLMMKPASPDHCETGERMLVNKPILADDVPRLDMILYTHTDGDHLGPLTAAALARTNGLFGGTAFVTRALDDLGVPPGKTRTYRIGETFHVGEVEITLTPADHPWQITDPARYGPPFGPEDCCGFLLRTPDGSIWCTGDSRLLPEHMRMEGVDVLLLDVSDEPFHFGIANMTKLANHLAEADLIAHHYGTYDAPDHLALNGDPAKLSAGISNSDRRLHVLAPGERFVVNRKHFQ